MAIAISVVAISGLVMIAGGGFSGVFGVSRKSQAVYQAQSLMEQALVSAKHQEGVQRKPEQITIQFNGLSIVSEGDRIIATGKTHEGKSKKTSTMISFVPQNTIHVP